MESDPLTLQQEARSRLEAVDPTMDKVNRLADAAEGMGLDPAGNPVWYGRRCCFFVVERLEVTARSRPVPLSLRCPACQRTWTIRVRAGLYRNASATA